MGRSKVIIPKRLVSDPARMARAIENQLNMTALAVKIDFGVTVQTWDDKPTFQIQSPTPWSRTVGTNDGTYGMLNEGTRPHTISPKGGGVLVFHTPFRSKTVPRSISSSSGSRGNAAVFTRRSVHHPGTEARAWDTTIAQKWDRLFGEQMQRAIDAAID